MGNSRTDFAIKNLIVTVTCQMLHLVTGFIGRTVLTRTMGAEYLGINGLFNNILTILSFAELGIGSTLVYRMYKPLAEGDEEKLAVYTGLYRRIYQGIIAVITVCGVAVIPFLPAIVKAPNVKENLTILYLLYLLDTIITYAFVYKKSILIADQKSYIVSVFTQAFNIVLNIAQCVVLILTHNFIFYFAVGILCKLLNNIVCSAYAQKRYPYISQTGTAKLSRQEINSLKTDVKGLLLGKLASTAFSGTDNIFISKFIGIVYVGILSNYTMLLNIVNGIMNEIFGSITASVGNLNVTGNMEQTEKVLGRMFFLNTSLYGYLTVGMVLLLQEFVTKIWLTEEYYLPFTTIVVILVELFYRSIHYPLYTVRNSLGLFSQFKWLSIVLAFLNILLDFLLVKPLGITGLYLSTIFCRLCAYCIDVYVVYTLAFKKSPLVYAVRVLAWSAFVVAECALCYILIQFVPIKGLIGFILKIVAITIAYFAGYLMMFRKTDGFIYCRTMVKKLIKAKWSRGKDPA